MIGNQTIPKCAACAGILSESSGWCGNRNEIDTRFRPLSTLGRYGIWLSWSSWSGLPNLRPAVRSSRVSRCTYTSTGPWMCPPTIGKILQNTFQRFPKSLPDNTLQIGKNLRIIRKSATIPAKVGTPNRCTHTKTTTTPTTNSALFISSPPMSILDGKPIPVMMVVSVGSAPTFRFF